MKLRTFHVQGLQPPPRQDLNQCIRRQKEKTTEVRALLPISVATFLLNEKRVQIAEIEKNQGVLIVIVPTESMHTPHYEVLRIRDDETIEEAASRVGLKKTRHNGAKAFGGHTLRRRGAQYPAGAGVDIWRIQALARHSSCAILGYIENAHVPALRNIASLAAQGESYAALAKEVAELKEKITKGLVGRAPA